MTSAPHSEPLPPALAITAAFSALVFTVAVLIVLAHPTPAIDMRLLEALRQPDQPGQLVGPRWLRIAAVDLTALGSTAVLGLISLLVVALMTLLQRWRDALLVTLAMIGGLSISQALKHSILRARPDDIYHAVEAHNPSFPSGHAMLSTTMFLALAVLVFRGTTCRSTRRFAWIAAMLGATLVGLSRIYLGVHWTTDVIAGWSAGAVWVCLCSLLTGPRSAQPAQGCT